MINVRRNDESPLRDLARKLRHTAREHIAYSQVAEFMNHIEEHLNALAYCEEINREKSQAEIQSVKASRHRDEQERADGRGRTDQADRADQA